uniref:Small ribosomal subunit protein uS17 n=1 Tax=candidate division WOR-3 bacterium TaxID=2052148 RepID=A0A7C4XK63_UNCW3
MRKTKVGVVLSDRMNKTRVVGITWHTKHPRYKKYLKKVTKVYAHDEKNEFRIGDKVLIRETRPLSRLKRWRVIKKLSE